MRKYSLLGCVALALTTASCGEPAPTPEQIVARGNYLVGVMGCGDCHTPGSLMGMPDATKRLAGSDVAFFMPGMGFFYPPNLTNDATGLAMWTPEQIVTAIRTGARPDGRKLAPIMPYASYANLTDADANGIAAYLKTLPGVMNQVPAPLGAEAQAPGPTMAVVAPPSLMAVGMAPSPPPPPPPPAARGGRGNAARGAAPGR